MTRSSVIWNGTSYEWKAQKPLSRRAQRRAKRAHDRELLMNMTFDLERKYLDAMEESLMERFMSVGYQFGRAMSADLAPSSIRTSPWHRPCP